MKSVKEESVNKDSRNPSKNKKVLRGVVVSDKMKDTIVVSVTRYLKHPKYDKYRKVQKRYKAHDEGNSKALGEKVEIIETSPISKDKRFRILRNEMK